MYYIYKITNRTTGKHYIGFTQNPAQRFSAHKCSKLYRPLYTSIKKYGVDNFDFEILYEHEDRDHVLFEMEPFFICQYDSYNNGYNCTRGGEDTNSIEARQASSERMKNNNPMKKLRTNKGSFKKGHAPVITEERNKKISESKKGKNNPNFGKTGLTKHLNEYVICDNCGVSMNKGNYKRWHISKCH